MARMKAMEVQQRTVVSDGATAEVIGPPPVVTRGGLEKPATPRKVSFRVRGAGRRRREGRSSALRQSTVAALTSKFNALTETQRLVIQEDTKSRGGGRYSVVLEPRAHPALVARLSAGTTPVSPGGVKAAIQIFEKNSVQTAKPTSEPTNHRNVINITTKSIKNPSLIFTTKAKNLTNIKKLDDKTFVNEITSNSVVQSSIVDKPKPLQTVIENVEKEKVVPTPPKPELKPISKSTFFLPLIKAPLVKPFVQNTKLDVIKSESAKNIKTESAKLVKPEVPVKNHNIIKEFLESTESLKSVVNNKPLNQALSVSNLKPNKSTLFLPLIKPSSPALVQSTSSVENDTTPDNDRTPVAAPVKEISESTESLRSVLKPPDLSPNVSQMVKELHQAFNRSRTDLTEDGLSDTDNTPTQETSLVTEVLNALAENKILSPLQEAEVKKPVLPNASFLWGSSAAQRDKQTCEAEDYDDVYVSSHNSYAALRSTLPRVPVSEGSDLSQDEEGAYEYCLGPNSSTNYDDCEGEANLIYDDVKSLAAASNCYESINGSCAPSYVDKNNSLYGLPEDLRGPPSSSGCSLQSSSPVGSRASTLSAEEGAPHEVLSYQLMADLGGVAARAEQHVERRSETGSDEWVDIELSESEEQLGPSRDLQETIVIVRERSRTRRSPSWSHKVRKQWSRSPKKRPAGMRAVYVTSSSVVYLLGPRHEAPAPPPRSRPPKPPRPPPPHVVPLVVLKVRLQQPGKFRESQELVTFFRDPAEAESSSSDSDHHYETLYEAVGGLGAGDAATLRPAHTPAPPPPLDEDEALDSDVTDSSFDSDTSEEPCPPVMRHAQIAPPPGSHLPPELPDTLPPPPPGSNSKKITKMAEAASKKMKNLRKNLTLRKRDLSDRLRRLSVTNPLPPNMTCAPAEVAPPKPPAAAPPLLEKSVSTGNLSGRKYWSFKDKFNRQTSTPALKNGARESSIFYVSQSGEQPDTDLGDRDNPNRRSTTESVCSSGRGSSAGSEVENVAPRRLSRTAMRPKTPPPPPPTDPSLKNLKNGKAWYAEIELSSLQPQTNNSSNESVTKNGHSIEGDHSWYSVIGTDGEADSSHTTESSESSNSPDGSVVHGCFADEPLYQFYAASVLEEAKRELSAESDSDGYEEIGEGGKVAKGQLVTRPSAMELIRPREGHRTLWCEVPDVIDSGVLATLNQQERKVQEAKFEIITSEASYVKSLNILATHFVQCPEFQDESIISKTDKHILFSNILPVKSCSERFLAELERCWQDNIMLHDICDLVYRHATKHFRVYVKYCSHQIYLDRTLRKLKENSSSFSESLARLEAAPETQSLSLHSFLMLPMQRVTRLPLLLDAVIRRLSARDPEYDSCKIALFALNKVVQECNEGARCMERMEEMLLLSRQLEFRDVRAVPLISSTRWLVRSGELTQLTWRDEAKLTFGRRFGKLPVCVFLFTDLLIVAKRKGEESFQVLDYCARNLVQVSSPEEAGEGALTQLPVRLSHGDSGKNLLLLTLLQNHEGRTVEMVLSCSLESDRQRWLSAFSPPSAPENPEERVYEEWDCPQVQAVHAYVARQPDELSLEVADVVNVLRKLPDGWYQGERIRDGERGWFPGNYCKEVLSSHVRARNLRQRYRLLALSREYIEQQLRAMQEQRKNQRRPVKPKQAASPVA